MPTASFRFDPTTLGRYGRLAIVARNLVEGFLTGAHKSPYKGFSVEFAEHRQYYPGDEIRHIDWRAYGKTDRYYIKEYEEETNLRAHIIVDASGSMAYKGKQLSKFEYAQQVAASLAYLMLQQRDAVGLVTHDTELRQMLPPRASTKHLLQILRILEGTNPAGETALAPIWDNVAARISRRGLVMILSDCFDETGDLLKSLRHFRFRKHEVVLFHILAPEEIEFPFRKWTQFRNLEVSGHKVLVDPANLRKEYRRNFDRFLEEIRKTATGAQVDYHLLRTDEPVERALGIYLARRLSRR
jgi:uncharacterized protein (DUF58 family)